jgi:hypothetical protein
MHHYLHYPVLKVITETSTIDWITAIGTVSAVVVALITPWIINSLNNKPKKSKLVVVGSSVINQDTAEGEIEENIKHLLNVGRIAIKNIGEHKAVAAEAYLEKVFLDDAERKNFIPMPLVWTHGQLNKSGPAIRDIYPNQTVYLDIYYQIYDDGYVNNNIVDFSLATAFDNKNLSFLGIGRSKILISIYQESGQVVPINIECIYDGKKAPSITKIF